MGMLAEVMVELTSQSGRPLVNEVHAACNLARGGLGTLGGTSGPTAAAALRHAERTWTLPIDVLARQSEALASVARSREEVGPAEARRAADDLVHWLTHRRLPELSAAAAGTFERVQELACLAKRHKCAELSAACERALSDLARIPDVPVERALTAAVQLEMPELGLVSRHRAATRAADEGVPRTPQSPHKMRLTQRAGRGRLPY